jgi:hypothetical protein
MGDLERRAFLDGLPARLAGAVGPAELEAATRPSVGSGIERRLEPSLIWAGTDRLPASVPRVVVTVEPPVDARDLCRAWGIERPVATSGDAHQRGWRVDIAGEELPDPFARRIAVRPFTAGRWTVRLDLAGRPAGALPAVVAGASPAYDVLERGGEIRRLEISPTAQHSAVVRGDHPDARALLDTMAARHPAWHSGWSVPPDADVGVVYDGDGPITGAAIGDAGGGTFLASRLCVAPDRPLGHAGSTLLDLLEAVVLARGGARLRLDDSAFLHAAAIPYPRHGYVVGPPYDGDADTVTWAERDLAGRLGP